MLVSSDPAVLGSTTTPGVVAVALLIGLLIAKEITTALPSRRSRLVGGVLDVGILPLLILSGVIVVTELGL